MSEPHRAHRSLTHAEQAERGAHALDAAEYRRRAQEQLRDEEADGGGDDRWAGSSVVQVGALPNPLGTSRPYATSERSTATKDSAAASATRRPLGSDKADAEDPLPFSRDHAAAHYASRRGGKTRRGIARRFAIGVTISLAVVAVGIGLFVHTISERMSAGIGSDLLAVLSGHSGDDPFYMLLLGIDRDEGRSAVEGEDYRNFRADTIILARIDARDATVTLVSIPRDTMVDLGEHGQQKLNAAYSLGGPAYITEVVRDLAGVDISHYAEVDLDGFVAIVDQVGGIDIELPVAIHDPDYTGLDLAAGSHHLDGYSALMLARSRHAYDAYGAGDYYRAANQRMIIGAVAHKVLTANPLTLTGTVSTLASYVTCDLDVGAIVGLATSMAKADGLVRFMAGQAPTTSRYVGDIWYEMLDTQAWQAMMARVDVGEPPYGDAGDPFEGIAGMAAPDGAPELDYSGTVEVLNATGAEGLAGAAAETLSARGFEATAGNASTESDASSIVYNGDDAEPKARAVAEALGIDAQPVHNDGTLPADANVIVILGADHAG